MRQQENKKENFRENPTKLTWIPKVYNYAERTGNLKAEAVGVVSGEKHFPVFEDRMVFKPLTKSKPFSTPLFACAEVFWSWVIDTILSRHLCISLPSAEDMRQNVRNIMITEPYRR